MELSFKDAIKARKEKFEKERAETSLSGKKTPRPEWVLKRYSDVSYEEYMRLVEQHVPFIVTDVCLLEGKENVWDFLSSTVGAKTVNVERRNEPCTLVTVKEVIERVHINNEEDLYMYDIPLAKKMPVLLESVRFPKYIAHDYLLRTMRDHPFKKAWPTMFIGAKGTHSNTHVDRWKGHFWMYMLEGTKEWTIFPEDEMCLLSPSFGDKFDPSFPHLPELEKTEDYAFTHPITLQLKKGELLFVPGGCPHFVKNVENSIAIAGNFVDHTNLERVLTDLKVTSLKYADDNMLYVALDEVEFEAEDDEEIFKRHSAKTIDYYEFHK